MSQRRLAEENQVVADLGRIMSSSLDIEEVYDVFVERMIKNLIPSDAVSINLIDTESGAFLTAYRRGPVGVLEGLGSPGSLVGSISEKVVESRAPVVVSETETGDMVSRYPRLAAQLEAGMRSFLVVPLIFKDEVFGTIAFDSTKAGNYSDPEVRLAQGIATQISGAVVSSQLYRDLRQTRDELQRLLAASPAMIFRATADGEYTTMFISDNVETVLGLEPRGIVEDPGMWTRRIHPQDRLKLSDEVVPALFDRGEAASEYRFLDARGSYRWLFERVEVLHDGDGKPLEVVGSVVDITEIKEAQLELQESEERYRTLFEQSQDAITISDVDRQVHRREPVVLGPGGPF